MALQTPLVLISGAFSTLPPGDTLGPSTDSVAQASGNAALVLANTALASGNAGISTGLTALASGNAGISTGLTALASGNAGISTGLTALASGNAALSLANLKLPLSGGVLTGDVILDNQVDARFREATASGVNYVGFQAPADIVSDILFTLPAADGAADQSIVTDGSGALSFASRSRLVSGTSVASTSGTSIDFTGIPSWVKRVTVMFSAVSTNGSDYLLVQLGTSGGMATDANYFSMTGATSTSNIASAVNYTYGFGIQSGSASNTLQGQYTFVNVTGDTWIASGTFTGNTASVIFAAGRRILSGALTQLRITSTGGTDTFDGGSINILYEG